MLPPIFWLAVVVLQTYYMVDEIKLVTCFQVQLIKIHFVTLELSFSLHVVKSK